MGAFRVVQILSVWLWLAVSCAAVVPSAHAMARMPACADLLTRPYSTAARGESWVTHHPHYPRMLRAARALGVTIEWVSDINKTGGFTHRAGEVTEGYFDETRNIIYLHRKQATVATLIHELRHAEQLGTAHGPTGSWYDREVQRARVQGDAFEREVLANNTLSDAEKIRLVALKDRLLIYASELSAHYHDALILIRRHAYSQARDSLYYRARYRRQFLYSYRILRSLLPTGADPEFIDRLARAADRYYSFSTKRLTGQVPREGGLLPAESSRQ